MSSFRPFVASIFLGIFLSCGDALAFRVSPMVVSFTPVGSGSTQNFFLENTSDEKIMVQIEAFHRFEDADGKETRTPTDEFSIYPQQIALQVNEKRSVRVTWTGNRQPDRELSYRLVLSELPLAIDAKKERDKAVHSTSSPTFLMQYVASLYVSPPNVSSKVTVESFKILPGSRGELTLKNSGLAHQVLKGIRFYFKTPDGGRVELKNDQTQELQAENLLANTSRRIYLTLPQSLVQLEKRQPGSVQAEIQQ